MLFAAITLLAASPMAAASPPAAPAPSFGEQTPVHGVVAIVDRGLVSEVIVRCAKGESAIVSFSKTEKVFCAPNGGCSDALRPIAARACGE